MILTILEHSMKTEEIKGSKQIVRMNGIIKDVTEIKKRALFDCHFSGKCILPSEDKAAQ